MSTDLMPFAYDGAQVRVLTDEHGDPWFVASDVAKILGYRDAANLTRRLDDEDRGTRSVSTPSGTQSMSTINEAGLYAAVLGSQVPAARPFKRWVTHEVLPEIRRTGSYAATTAAPALPKTYAEALRELAAEVEAKEIAQARAAELEHQAAEDAPKLEYVQRYVSESDVITVDAFAAQHGVTGPAVRALLLERRVAYRKALGQRWSESKRAMVDVTEWRPRAGRTQEWFDLRPQHNAPRHHNGQVKQTLYVRQVHSTDLARKLGLADRP